MVRQRFVPALRQEEKMRQRFVPAVRQEEMVRQRFVPAHSKEFFPLNCSPSSQHPRVKRLWKRI